MNKRGPLEAKIIIPIVSKIANNKLNLLFLLSVNKKSIGNRSIYPKDILYRNSVSIPPNNVK